MTPSDQADQESRRESAKRDLQDISVLRRTEAFSRYFLRKIEQLRSENKKIILYKEKVAPEELEKARHNFSILNYLSREMMKRDEALCMRELE